MRKVLELPDGPGLEGSSWMRESGHSEGPIGALEWIWSKNLFLQQMLIELLIFVSPYFMY